MNSNYFILVPRQKHFKNNIKIISFKDKKYTSKKELFYYKITFKNNIFIIKEIDNINKLKNISKYINKIELYSKIILYSNGNIKRIKLA